MVNMIPRITKGTVLREGMVMLPNTITYSDDSMKGLPELLAKRLCKMGFTYEANHTKDNPFLRFSLDNQCETEAYRLEISPDGVTIYAAGRQGINLALVTLFQCVRDQKGKLPCGIFQDAPLYGYRGFMLDVSRHFFSTEEIKKILEQCALLKLNRFHWHLSDNQGFRIESERFPLLNSIGSWNADPLMPGKRCGGFYTKQEIRSVVDFAFKRGIEVIPEIDLPGHTSAIIASYPTLSCSEELTEVASDYFIHERILCAGKEDTYDFLELLLDEVCELFTYKYFHIGGDEAPKNEWQKCKHCQRTMQEHRFTDYEQLQTFFTERIERILAKRSKQIIGWNEILKSGHMAVTAVAQYWTEAVGENNNLYSEVAKGRRFIFSANNHFYFDFPYANITMKATYSYVPHIGVKYDIPKESILGVEAPLWTEQHSTDDAIEYQIFPRLLALAENAWSGGGDFDEFCDRIKEYYPVFEKFEITCASYDEAVIGGIKGAERVAAYMIGIFTQSSQRFSSAEGIRFIETPIAQRLNNIFSVMIREHMISSYTEEEICYAEALYLKAVQKI